MSKQAGSLAGKVALVTGASKGIGAAIAQELGARGAAVAVNYASDAAGAERVVESIRSAGGRAIAVQANVGVAEEIPGLLDRVVQEFGPLDVVVNNAGVYEFLPLEAVTVEHYERQFRVNVLGLLLVTKEAVARFRAGGGSVINVGSVVGRMASAYGSVYGATKGAVDSITVALAKELGPKQIRVNAVNPGLILTEGAKAQGVVGSDFERDAVAHTPLGRVGTPEDVATVAAFLASDDAKWVSGQLIQAAGGFSQ